MTVDCLRLDLAFVCALPIIQVRMALNSCARAFADVLHQVRISRSKAGTVFCNFQNRPPQEVAARLSAGSAWQLLKQRCVGERSVSNRCRADREALFAGSENKDYVYKADRWAKDWYQWSKKEDKCVHWRKLPCKLVRTLKIAFVFHTKRCWVASLQIELRALRTLLVMLWLRFSVLRRIQSLFNSLGDEVKGKTIGLGGDGRYFNKQAAQIIIKMAAANGVKKVLLLAVAVTTMTSLCDVFGTILAQASSALVQVLVGQNAIMATPAMSALIRRRKLYGKQQFFSRQPAELPRRNHAYSTANTSCCRMLLCYGINCCRYPGQSYSEKFNKLLAASILSHPKQLHSLALMI